MKILLINHYAGGPSYGMEFRPYYLAREWVRQGHEVLVVGGTYSHLRHHQPAAGDQVVEGVRYRWLDTPAYDGNGVGRLRNIMAFLSRLGSQAPSLAAQFKPDAVIASSTYPMDTWVARRIAGYAGALLVHEVHDLWPLSLVELSGMSSWHPFVLICQSAENSAYRASDMVVTMLPKAHPHLERHGADPSRIVVVPNGISPDDWQGPFEPLRDDVATAIAAARGAGSVVVGHAGSMGLPNALDTLLDAAKLLLDSSIRIVLVGDGHERLRLAARIEAEGLHNVSWFPPVPKAQVPSLLAAFDIAYLGWQRQPIYRFGIAPNKLMDYMMAGKPVLHAVEAGNDPVADAGCGLTVEPESAAAVARGMRQLAALSPAQRQVLGGRGRGYVVRHHSYPALAARFVDAIRSFRPAAGGGRR